MRTLRHLPVAVLALAAATVPACLAAQQVGGAQTSNTHVNAAPANPSGSTRVPVRPARRSTSGTAAVSMEPKTVPSDPAAPIELSPEQLQRLVLHREPAIYPRLAQQVHSRGAVVIDVSMDESGKVEAIDSIGAQDFCEAALNAIDLWKFSPYLYHGQPRKVTSWVRFEFTDPAKGTSN